MIYLTLIDSPEDKVKFLNLYEQYKHFIWSKCFEVLQDEHLAEDATHEAFIKIAKNMSKIKDVESNATKRYLIIIAENSAIDIYRKRSKQMQHETGLDEADLLEDLQVEPEGGFDHDMTRILADMAAIYRDVLILKYSNEFTNKEIAKTMGISEAVVRQRLKRGKEIIRKELDNVKYNA
ncbi:MAG: RNA polymerase sigma factor [Lachnospiraceae bacterium]|nr:RNA polymerase sigma factor [Lachnospiraceae bacterium]